MKKLNGLSVIVIIIITLVVTAAEDISDNLNESPLLTDISSNEKYVAYEKIPEPGSFEIKLRDGFFVPEANNKNKPNLKSAISDVNKEYYLIQFENRDRFKEEYEFMKTNGIKLIEYIP